MRDLFVLIEKKKKKTGYPYTFLKLKIIVTFSFTSFNGLMAPNSN